MTFHGTRSEATSVLLSKAFRALGGNSRSIVAKQPIPYLIKRALTTWHCGEGEPFPEDTAM
jgi:hypothetical protein